MKTQLLRRAAALAFSGLILGGCQKELTGVEALELSEYQTITFDQTGGQKEITVTTGNPGWTAAPNADWIKVNQLSHSFTVSTEANPTTKTRSGEVVVRSGSLTERIPVEQAPMSDELFVSAEKINLDQSAQEVVLSVKSRSGDWSVEENLPDWIKATRVLDEDRLNLSFSANNTKAERSHKVFIHGKEVVREIEVTQAPKLVLLLPLLMPEATTDEVRAFEEGRKSKLQEDAGYLYGGSHTYVTLSDELRVIKYTFDKSKELVEAQLVSDELKTITSEKFAEFLESNGFKYIGDNTVEMVYVKKMKKGDTAYEVVANITYSMANPNFYSKVLFRFVKGQRGAHPTFNSLPLGIGRFDVTMNDVAAWESTHGGKVDELNTDKDATFSYIFYNVFDHIYVTRRYIFHNQKDVLGQMDIFFYDVNKFFYSPEEGKYLLTNEFKELLTKEGFTDIQRVDNNPQFPTFYNNPARGIAVAFRVGQYDEINDAIPVAHMLVVPIQKK